MRNRILILAVGILMLCPLSQAAFAQQQKWQSTSTMQSSGSVYSPQVTAVGAVAVESQATTTTGNNSPSHHGRIRKSTDTPGELTTYIDPSSPLGDAVLPLMLMALAYMGLRVFRARKRAEEC